MWICEFCFRQSSGSILPAGWDLMWQSVVCPECQQRVARDGGYSVVNSGAYAEGRLDPRLKTILDTIDLKTSFDLISEMIKLASGIPDYSRQWRREIILSAIEVLKDYFDRKK